VRQRDPHSVAAGQVFHRASEIDLGKSQPHQNAFGFVFGKLVAMRGVEYRFASDGFEFLGKIPDPEAGPFPD